MVQLNQINMKYRIVNGRLVNSNGDIIPLEVGNAEQIEFIRQQETIAEEQKNKGIELDVTYSVLYRAEADFLCECGQRVFIEVEADDEDDIECLDGIKKACRKCKTTYDIIVTNENEVRAKREMD